MAGFADAIAAFAVKAQANIDTVTADSIRDAGGRLVELSPAPEKGNKYATGRFVSNWRYALESPDRQFSADINLREVNDLADLPAKAAGFVHYITNSAPYAHFLEFGTSRMAPQPTVGVVAVEWEGIVAANAQKVAA